MEQFFDLFEEERILLEIQSKVCFWGHKTYLTTHRIIEHEKKLFCGQNEEVYCTFLKDIKEFKYVIKPLCFLGPCWPDQEIIFKTDLSIRSISLSMSDDLTRIAALFSQAIDNAQR